jgi:predicted MFS family arabinose efflux permease
VLLCAVGLALLPAASLHGYALALLVLAPLVIGAGYGPITPASSQVLARTAPPSRMALTFSIKQTGVPAGAALGGAILPALALALGWRWTLVAVAACGIFVAIGAQRIRSDLDRGRNRARPGFALAGIFAPVKRIFADPLLAELTIVSFFYAAMQVSLTSFLVVYLTEAQGRSLVAAGFALTVATIGGVAGRVLWGIVADHYVAPRVLLGLLGIAAGALSLSTAAYPLGGPAAPLLALCAAFGATAIGWNGVQLAELARRAPAGEAAAITGAAGFIGFSGVVLGPPTFGLLASLTGDYRAGFVAMGAAVMACGGWMLWRQRKRQRNGGGGSRG